MASLVLNWLQKVAHTGSSSLLDLLEGERGVSRGFPMAGARISSLLLPPLHLMKCTCPPSLFPLSAFSIGHHFCCGKQVLDTRRRCPATLLKLGRPAPYAKPGHHIGMKWSPPGFLQEKHEPCALPPPPFQQNRNHPHAHGFWPRKDANSKNPASGGTLAHAIPAYSSGSSWLAVIFCSAHVPAGTPGTWVALSNLIVWLACRDSKLQHWGRRQMP